MIYLFANGEDHIPVSWKVCHLSFLVAVSLMHFAGRASNSEYAQSPEAFLKAAAEGHGARLTEVGEIELDRPPESASGFSRYAATPDLVRWEHDRKGDTSPRVAEVFVQEVALVLIVAWKKSTPQSLPKVRS